MRHAAYLSVIGLLLVLGAAVPACQAIAGIEERTLDEQMALCREYCDVVMTNCSGDNAVYPSEGLCFDVCLALDPGTISEPLGNTVACRLDRAQNAEREPEVNCRFAGPGGGDGPCGSDCEAWCTLLESVCDAQFRQLGENCEDRCENVLVDLQSFDLRRDLGGDTLQCRLVHTVVAFEDAATHCPHSGFVPTEMCVEPNYEPTCEELCRHTQGTCQEELAVYESTEQCMSACRHYEQGAAEDRAEATLGCRIYHAITAGLDRPDLHCPHAGPTGEGVCGPDDGLVTGNCMNYCLLLEAACGEDEGWVWADQVACSRACSVDLAGKGAEAIDGGYSLLLTESGDTLQCRTRHAVRALSDRSHCDAAFGAAPCR